MYFYELHESDDDLFNDVMLAHDSEYDEQEMLELVLEARQEVLGGFEEDSLIEAVARQLSRKHGFVYIDDQQLRAAINVSVHEGETVVTPVDERRALEADDGDEGFRTLLVDIEPEEQRWRDN
ncbi:hypothetical protein BH24CHL6_BH24CHL6_01470 [soil metagenome]